LEVHKRDRIGLFITSNITSFKEKKKRRKEKRKKEKKTKEISAILKNGN